jgi:hypothetical protein
MGSFNMSCGLTNGVIAGGDDVVMILLTPRNHSLGRSIAYSWDHWSPIPILLEGTYDTYGNLENISFFQSKGKLKNSDKALEAVFKDLKESTQADYNGYVDNVENLTDLFSGRDLSLLKADPKFDLLKTCFLEYESASEAIKPQYESVVKQVFGKNIHELKEYLEETKDKKMLTPLNIVMFKKDPFLKVVNELGVNDKNEDSLAVSLQKARKKDLRKDSTAVSEYMDFILGTKAYAGGNNPLYGYANIIEKTKDKELIDDLKHLQRLHAIDTMLIHEFFSVLGKVWQPAMILSEDIKYYGHTEAFALQQELLKSVIPQETKKIIKKIIPK